MLLLKMYVPPDFFSFNLVSIPCNSKYEYQKKKITDQLSPPFIRFYYKTCFFYNSTLQP